MEKLLGILPYIYFDEPIQIGPIKFLNIPDLLSREHAPSDDILKQFLKEISGYFPVLRGLKSDTGAIRAFTYFLLENNDNDDEQTIIEAKKAITLLRYSMLRPEPQKLDNLETSSVYTFEIPPSGNQETRIYHGWINFNQEEWLTPSHDTFYPPGWYVDFLIEYSSNLHGLESINQLFYNNVFDKETEANFFMCYGLV